MFDAKAAKMDVWAQLYEVPTPIGQDWGHHRIYAPAAYHVIRTLQLVPIVHTEVLSLAHLFPVCWLVSDGSPTLCVLRSLLEDGTGMPHDMKARSVVLPLAFQAYPIIVPQALHAEPPTIVFDRAIADRPTDIGAPLLMSDGQLTRATKIRARTALAAGRMLPTTSAISRFLYEAELLEPWPLQFDLGCKSVDIRNLMVVSAARLDHPKIYQTISKFGADAAVFLSASRLSLFRMSNLLSRAKSAVASELKTLPRAAVA